SYLYVVDRLQMHGQLVNFWRLPGYPLFIVLVYMLAGQGNLGAVSIAQAMLFVLTTVELYILCALMLRRAWMAFLISLLVSINVPLLSYVKPIMSEAMALWLLVSLALACIYFLSTLQIRRLWLVTDCMLLLFLTRPEWIFLPVPLFAYLLLVAWWHGKARRLLLHGLASILLLYGCLGGYIYINATQNHFVGLTWIENINALGKVLQYNMQDEAPLQYAHVSKILDRYAANGVQDPYVIFENEPSLGSNDAALAGTFAKSIIEHHPVEFLVKSVPVFFSSLTIYYRESSITPHAHFAHYLNWLDNKFQALYKWNIFFPPCALIWFLLLCWQWTRRFHTVQMMGVVVLLAFYGLIAMTLGAYRGFDYVRIHVTLDPLFILIIWGTFLIEALLIVQHGPEALMWLADRSFLHQRLSTSQASMIVAGFCIAGLGLFVVRLLRSPGISSLIGIGFLSVMSIASIFRAFYTGKANLDYVSEKEDIPI
ncbi:MAG TPA: hypothetical protein VH593_13160, partial [Ktedonobacteraceae bacterium]